MEEKLSKKEEKSVEKKNTEALEKSKLISTMGQKKYAEMMARRKF